MLSLRIRHNRSIVGLLIGLIFLTGASPVLVSARPATPTNGAAIVAQSGAAIGARAALAVDLTSGLELFNFEGDTSVPAASTVKIVTALVAREVLGLDEEVVIQEPDLRLPEDYSKMGLELGDVTTVRVLLQGMLVVSGGDAALALARVAGQRLDPESSDPVQRFVDEMNAFAESNGLTGSHFSNPDGMDSDGYYMTARDLVRAAERLLHDWFLAQTVATAEAVVTVDGPNAREIYLSSTNQLVLDGESFGVKTGSEEAAGECLVNVTWRGDHKIVTVVLGSSDRYADTHALLDFIDQSYRYVPLGGASPSLGATDDLAAQGLSIPVGRTIVMTPAQADSLQYDLEMADEKSPAGKVGTIVFRSGEREVLRLPVYAVD